MCSQLQLRANDNGFESMLVQFRLARLQLKQHRWKYYNVGILNRDMIIRNTNCSFQKTTMRREEETRDEREEL
jgi:hypothetical protein